MRIKNEREDMGMKRILTLLLMLIMVLALCACGKSGRSDADNPTPTNEITVEDVDFTFNEKTQEYEIRIKARNNGIELYKGKRPTWVLVRYQLLDEKGDVLPLDHAQISGYEDLAVGQAGWGGVYHGTIKKSLADKAESITFPSYVLFYKSINDDGTSEEFVRQITDPLIIPLADVIPSVGSK